MKCERPFLEKIFILHEDDVHELDGTHKSDEPVSNITLIVCPGVPTLEINFKQKSSINQSNFLKIDLLPN